VTVIVKIQLFFCGIGNTANNLAWINATSKNKLCYRAAWTIIPGGTINITCGSSTWRMI